jgi:hypothetical protein
VITTSVDSVVDSKLVGPAGVPADMSENADPMEGVKA